jgi:hypothetical protein
VRRPHLSTGAWLFGGIVAAALIAPAGVYAAVNSHVAIGNPGNTTTAIVDAEHQLLTTTIDPRNIVRFAAGTSTHGCTVLYTPPAGKALVVLSLTVELETPGSGGSAALTSGAACANVYDVFATNLLSDAEQRIYPAGLPIPNLSVKNFTNTTNVLVTGYLIPTSQLPAAVQVQSRVQFRDLSR